MSTENVLILGFGDIAKRLTHQLTQVSNPCRYNIRGVKRSPATTISHEYLQLIQGDCTDHQRLSAILQVPADVIVMTLTPDEMSDAGYKRSYVDTTNALLLALREQTYQPRLLLFVSSSSVYHQSDNEWVDEHSVAQPLRYSGQRLLEAEQLLVNSPYHHCIVRFSGIYGPGRQRLIDQVVSGNIVAKEPALYSNRIHADDCAGVLAHLINRQRQQPIKPLYLASDCEPVPLYTVQCWLADQLNVAVSPPLSATIVSHASASNTRSSKRCANQRLLDSGYQFQYPTFREGYTAVLKDIEQ